jgi:hypothetical protein
MLRRLMRRIFRPDNEPDEIDNNTDTDDIEDVDEIEDVIENENQDEEEIIDDFVDLGHLIEQGIDNEIDDAIKQWAPDANDDIYIDLDQIEIQREVRDLFRDNVVIFNIGTRRIRPIGSDIVRNSRNRRPVDMIIGAIVEQKYREYQDARLLVKIVRHLLTLKDSDLRSSEDSDEEGCVVCMERKSMVEFNCGHRRTCAKCSTDVIRSNHLCPMCRVEITTAV